MSILSLLSLVSLSHAAEAHIVNTRIGDLLPAVLVAVDTAVEPSRSSAFVNDGRVATATVAYDGEQALIVVLGVDEARAGLSELWFVSGETPVRVYTPEEVSRFVPPDPYLGAEIPPDPYLEFVAVFGDRTRMTIGVDMWSEGGTLDAGSVIGTGLHNPPTCIGEHNPPGDFGEHNPPGYLEIDLSAYARGGARFSVEVSLSAEGEALELR